jgi:hypothetical protein
MSNTTDEFFLPVAANPLTKRVSRTRIIAFVPIVVALVGVGAILLGHVSAPTASVAAKEPTVDPVVTGSIAAPDKPDEIGRTIEMLDR